MLDAFSHDLVDFREVCIIFEVCYGQDQEVVALLVDGAPSEQNEEVWEAEDARRGDSAILEEPRALTVLRLLCHKGPLLFLDAVSDN